MFTQERYKITSQRSSTPKLKFHMDISINLGFRIQIKHSSRKAPFSLVIFPTTTTHYDLDIEDVMIKK